MCVLCRYVFVWFAHTKVDSHFGGSSTILFLPLLLQRTSPLRVKSPALKCVGLCELPSPDDSPQALARFAKSSATRRKDHCAENLTEKPLSEIFHFWKLAGGDVVREYDLQFVPPILSMPRVVRLSGYVAPPLQPAYVRSCLFSPILVPGSLDLLSW
jgi:hypothetical protein